MMGIARIRLLIIGVVLSMVTVGANAAQWQTEAAGGFSRVELYVPDADGMVGNGRSLLIVLHGCVQPTGSFKTANLDVAAEEYGMVIVVPDAMNKAGFSCWDYWSGGISRSAGDYKNLINLAKEYKARGELDIDPDRVYIAGLNSGGTFAMTTWCLAPDIFSGVSVVGAPPIGVTGTGIGLDPTPEDTAQRCRSYAGKYAEYFSGQKASIASGSSNNELGGRYGPYNAAVMAIVTGADKLGSTQVKEMYEEKLWGGYEAMGIVSLLELYGVGDAWPGGAGASGAYIDGTNINYAMYLGKFFNVGPEIPQCTVELSDFVIKHELEVGEALNIEGEVQIGEQCELVSIKLAIDGEKRDIDGTSVAEEFNVDAGEHRMELNVLMRRLDGVLSLSYKKWEFSTKTIQVVPAWCNYFPEMYWKWMPSCAVGL